MGNNLKNRLDVVIDLLLVAIVTLLIISIVYRTESSLQDPLHFRRPAIPKKIKPRYRVGLIFY